MSVKTQINNKMERIDVINKAEIMRDKLASEGFYYTIESCMMQVMNDMEKDRNVRPIRRKENTSTCVMCANVKHGYTCVCDL